MIYTSSQCCLLGLTFSLKGSTVLVQFLWVDPRDFILHKGSRKIEYCFLDLCRKLSPKDPFDICGQTTQTQHKKRRERKRALTREIIPEPLSLFFWAEPVVAYSFQGKLEQSNLWSLRSRCPATAACSDNSTVKTRRQPKSADLLARGYTACSQVWTTESGPLGEATRLCQ